MSKENRIVKRNEFHIMKGGKGIISIQSYGAQHETVNARVILIQSNQKKLQWNMATQ